MNISFLIQRIWTAVTITILLALLASCTKGGTQGNSPTTAPAPPSNALAISIAYSPEKKAWLEERISVFHAQNVQVNGRAVFISGTEKSSGEARTDIKLGSLKPTVWSPSASTWLEVLIQETGNPNVAVFNKPLVLTPVVISMWKPMAEAMGWPNTPIGWSDMLELINDPKGWGKFGHPEWGKFSWGHTDPEISTTALSTLIAEFYAATGKQRGLTAEDIRSEKSRQFIRDLGNGIKHYGYNTLVFSQNMRKFGVSYISAFPMEEITLIEFNKSAPATPLVAIYPKEGTFVHDDPFIIMASATPDEQAAAQKFYEFLMTPDSQTLAMSYGFRPASTQVPLADPISAAFGVNPQGVQNILEVPSASVIVEVKNSWKENRKRADIVLVVDVSGSMRGEKIEMVKAGLESFLQRLLPEDRVGLITFSNEPTVIVQPAALSDNRILLQDHIGKMDVQGETAVYDAVSKAIQVVNEIPQPAEQRIRAIVLLSDGLDNSSKITLSSLAQQYGESGISIFPVAYGDDADITSLETIADFSRTIVVKGNTGNIAQIFDNLSRYF